MAKPMEGVAGSGEHTHLGLAAKLKDGRVVSMFSSKDGKDFLNVIGYGALMGILNNYEQPTMLSTDLNRDLRLLYAQ